MEIRAKYSQLYRVNYEATKPICINQGGTSCFDGSQLVITKEGSKPISEIQEGDIVKCYDEETKAIKWKPVLNTFEYQNTKPTIKITLKNGRTITATEDHKIFFEGGWHSLKSVIFDKWKHGK